MDDIGPRREERLRELGQDLAPVFGNGQDADLAAIILVMALASPSSAEDRLRYLAVLERLPKGSAAEPRVLRVCPHSVGAALHWRVTFGDGAAKYQSLRHFRSKAEADDYASDFLVRLRGEINRP